MSGARLRRQQDDIEIGEERQRQRGADEGDNDHGSDGAGDEFHSRSVPGDDRIFQYRLRPEQWPQPVDK
jgi:hypothetical protein